MSEPKIYTQLITFPGIPIETVTNAVGLLMNVHGVQHQLTVNPEGFSSDALVTGNEVADIRATNQYLELNGLLGGLSRDHELVTCDTKSDSKCLHLTLTCK